MPSEQSSVNMSPELLGFVIVFLHIGAVMPKQKRGSDSLRRRARTETPWKVVPSDARQPETGAAKFLKAARPLAFLREAIPLPPARLSASP